MSKSSKVKKFYSSREAADLLHVAVSTVQLWTNNGQLKAWTTAGGHRRIYKESVENILCQQQNARKKNKSTAMSIVIVEDNPQERMLYTKQFKESQLNTNVYVSNDGYMGLINIGMIMPDIIITDLLMPNMNGFEMIKAIKENSNLKNSLIIVVSALTDDEIDKRGKLPENILVFHKPLPFDELEMFLNGYANKNVA